MNADDADKTPSRLVHTCVKYRAFRKGSLTLIMESNVSICSSGCINNTSVDCWIHMDHVGENSWIFDTVCCFLEVLFSSIWKAVFALYNVWTIRKRLMVDKWKYLSCPPPNTEEKKILNGRHYILLFWMGDIIFYSLDGLSTFRTVAFQVLGKVETQ